MRILGNIISNSESFYKAKNLPVIQVGDTVKVTIYLELPREQESDAKKVKERIQVYEGVVISKHGNSKYINSTITVRKMFQGGGIEKVFILNSPWIKNITVVTSAKVRRSKLYYLRERTGKSARLKRSFKSAN